MLSLAPFDEMLMTLVGLLWLLASMCVTRLNFESS